MNSFEIKISKKITLDVKKITEWLQYTPYGHRITRREKDLLASYIALYLEIWNSNKNPEENKFIINSFVFGNYGNKIVREHVGISPEHAQVIKGKLVKTKCLVINEFGQYTLNKDIIPKIEENGDIVVTVRIKLI